MCHEKTKAGGIQPWIFIDETKDNTIKHWPTKKEDSNLFNIFLDFFGVLFLSGEKDKI